MQFSSFHHHNSNGSNRNTSSIALASLSFLSGALVFVLLSNMVQFHSLIIVQRSSGGDTKIPSIHVWLEGGDADNALVDTNNNSQGAKAAGDAVP